MLTKKLIVLCLTVMALSVPGVTVYANDCPDCVNIVKEAPVSKKKHKYKSLDSMTSEELKKLAEKFNIDITGLSDEQIKEKIKESRPKHHRLDKMTSPELKSLAEKLKIDVTGLSDEQIKEKIKQVIKEKNSKQD